MNLLHIDVVINLLALFGVAVILHFLWGSIKGVLHLIRFVLAPYFLSTADTSFKIKYGEWALITGCTDGIGLEYARELAQRGLNIILVSRNEAKLQKTAAALESEFLIKTKIIQTDFSLGAKAIDVVKSELGNLDVGILVNNVGRMYEYPMYLGEVQENDLWEIININIGAVTLMTRLFVGEMKKKGRGAIINISSASELVALPLMAVYAASKCYVQSFTAAIRNEYAGTGITIQSVAPFFVNTKMNHYNSLLQKTSIFVPDAASYANYAVNTIGKLNYTTGYWSHGIQHFFVTLVPGWLRTLIGGVMNRFFYDQYLITKTK